MSETKNYPILEQLVLLYLEKNYDKFDSPEELKDLYWEIKNRIRKHKSPNSSTANVSSKEQ